MNARNWGNFAIFVNMSWSLIALLKLWVLILEQIINRLVMVIIKVAVTLP